MDSSIPEEMQDELRGEAARMASAGQLTEDHRKPVAGKPIVFVEVTGDRDAEVAVEPDVQPIVIKTATGLPRD